MVPSSEAERAPRLLVVEDDPAIASSLVRGLRAAGFEIELVQDGDAALERGLDPRTSLIILDVNLPGLSGFQLLEAWRARGTAPVLVLTSRSDLEDRLRVFELGALDFVPKPFFVEEVVARVRARLRVVPEERRRLVTIGGVVLDLDARRLVRGDEELTLTRQELNVLAYLAERPGRAVSRNALAEAVLEPGSEIDGRSIDAHVARIRKKLGPDGARIATVWGIGYRLEVDG